MTYYEVKYSGDPPGSWRWWLARARQAAGSQLTGIAASERIIIIIGDIREASSKWLYSEGCCHPEPWVISNNGTLSRSLARLVTGAVSV